MATSPVEELAAVQVELESLLGTIREMKAGLPKTRYGEDLTDDERLQIAERMRSISDEDLVYVMLALLGRPEWDETPMIAAASHKAASTARCALAQLLERWVPAHLQDEALARLYDDERPELTLMDGGADAR